ncbi:hypothetical protein [Deinococcus marmoris]|uniref:hypothetical protein n=1 Tax=Deinococcus marmoris TaxID=249408 RepID=UPI0012DC09B8|nr:hypothetical protein [Deinococcus marmoris]
MIYTKSDLIKSRLDAERYASSDPVLQEDTRQFTEVLQRAFQIPIDDFHNTPNLANAQWPYAMMFRHGASIVLAQDSGFLEAGLLYSRLEQEGESGQKILEQYALIGQVQRNVTELTLRFLIDIIETLWPDAPETVTSTDLTALGFDDSQRPDPMDFW